MTQEAPVLATVALQLGLGGEGGLPAFTPPLQARFRFSAAQNLDESTCQIVGLSTQDMVPIESGTVSLEALIVCAFAPNDRVPENARFAFRVKSRSFVDSTLVCIGDSTQEDLSLFNTEWPPFDIAAVEALAGQTCQPWSRSSSEP